MMKWEKFSEARLRNAQDKVLEGYKVRFGLSKSETGNLHMFFSPTRVPKGLTREEVREVLRLYAIREEARQKTMRKLLKEAGKSVEVLPAKLSKTGRSRKFIVQNLPSLQAVVRETILPEEFIPHNNRMTRGAFRMGVMKLLESLATE